MVDQELRVKIIPDLSQLKADLSKLGVISGGGGGAGGDIAGATTGGGRAGVGKGIGGASALGFLGKILNGILKIVPGIALIAAFFDAVGPIMKILFKTLSAVILILLTPFLKLFIPLLRAGIPALINFSKLIAERVQKLFDAFKLPEAFQKLAEGDIKGFFETVFSGLAPGIKTWIDLILDDFAFIFGFLPEPFKDVFDKIIVAARFVNDKLFGDSGWFLKFVVGIAEVVDILFGGGGLWLKIISGLLNVKDNLLPVFNSIVDALSDFLGKIRALLGFFGIGGGSGGGSGGGGGGGGGAVGGSPQNSRFLAGNFSRVRGLGTSPDFLDLVRDVTGGSFGDFISRPGQSPVSFSPGDTIIGTKNPGALGGGGMTVNQTININADVDVGSLRRKIEEANREMIAEWKRQGSFVGRTFNA